MRRTPAAATVAIFVNSSRVGVRASFNTLKIFAEKLLVNVYFNIRL